MLKKHKQQIGIENILLPFRQFRQEVIDTEIISNTMVAVAENSTIIPCNSKKLNNIRSRSFSIDSHKINHSHKAFQNRSAVSLTMNYHSLQKCNIADTLNTRDTNIQNNYGNKTKIAENQNKNDGGQNMICEKQDNIKVTETTGVGCEKVTRYSICKVLAGEKYLDEIMLFKLKLLQNYINVDNQYTKEFPIMLSILPNRVKIKRQPKFRFNQKRKDPEVLKERQQQRTKKQSEKFNSITLEYFQMSIQPISPSIDYQSQAKSKFTYLVQKLHHEVMNILEKMELSLELNNVTDHILKFIKKEANSYHSNSDKFKKGAIQKVAKRVQVKKFSKQQMLAEAIPGKN